MRPTYRILLTLLAVVLAPLSSRADIIMSVTYYTDDTPLGGSGTVSNEVQNSLGVDGLPILNTAAYGCTSNCYTGSFNSTQLLSDGEITSWSSTLNPTNNVTQTGTGTVTLDAANAFTYTNSRFYPPNGSGPNDGSGFQAAVFSSVLNVPTSEAINFTVGADDDVFVYVNGQIVCDLGGVHGDSPGTCSSGVLNAGSNTLQVFYADEAQTGAALTFGITTSGITGSTPAPEPASLAILTTALVGIGAARKRARRNRADAVT
jgi:fibro-slime domain-containing protein